MPNTTKRLILWAIAVACVLLIPLVAMQFSEEVNWSLFDFIFAGGILFGAGLTYELVARKGKAVTYRVGVGLAILTAVLLVWVTGAVGIIGSENNPANLLYLGVLATGLLGAFVTRLQPQGMSRALFVTALAQVLVPVIALAIWQPHVTSWGTTGVAGVFMLNGFFTLLWMGSALLFRQAITTDR